MDKFPTSTVCCILLAGETPALLPSETQDFVAKIKQLDFEERINFMRSPVVEMGA